MPIAVFGPAGDAFAGAFGVTAAVLLLGGPIVLRWQRNRHQFQLMQTALTQGVTQFPKGPPMWLLSLRQGISTLMLGIALLIAGGVATGATHDATPPTEGMISAAAPQPDEPPPAASQMLRPAPPRPNPAIEQWHRVQAINSLGLMSLAAGMVLTLLGSARVLFARLERQHESDGTIPGQ